jgi:hypothetical protein
MASLSKFLSNENNFIAKVGSTKPSGAQSDSERALSAIWHVLHCKLCHVNVFVAVLHRIKKAKAHDHKQASSFGMCLV